MRREIEEETGLKVSGTRYLFSIPNTYMYSGMELHTMDLFFLCTVKESAALTADDDVAELQWIAIEELRSEEFGLASIKKAIEKLKEIKNTL